MLNKHLLFLIFVYSAMIMMMGSIKNLLEALNEILAREAVKPKRSSYDNEGLKRVSFEPFICSPRAFFSRFFFLPFVPTKLRDSREPETGSICSIYEKILLKKITKSP